MRFFTPEWHQGLLDDDESAAARDAYWRLVDDLEPSLPPAVAELARTSIHDGLVRRVALDEARGALRLELRCGDLGRGYFDLDLVYHGVELAAPDVERLARIARDPRCEALYDEVDRAPGAGFVHRVLFIADDYDEVAVAFTRLDLARTPRPDREFPRLAEPFVRTAADDGTPAHTP